MAAVEGCEADRGERELSGSPHRLSELGSIDDQDGRWDRTRTGAGRCLRDPPGHDGWVVGDEPVVSIDFTGMAEYAKPK